MSCPWPMCIVIQTEARISDSPAPIIQSIIQKSNKYCLTPFLVLDTVQKNKKNMVRTPAFAHYWTLSRGIIILC